MGCVNGIGVKELVCKRSAAVETRKRTLRASIGRNENAARRGGIVDLKTGSAYAGLRGCRHDGAPARVVADPADHDCATPQARCSTCHVRGSSPGVFAPGGDIR